MSEFDESNPEQSRSWSMSGDSSHSIAGRARVRAQLQRDIDAYLRQGGRIQEVGTALGNEASRAPRKVELGFDNRSF